MFNPLAVIPLLPSAWIINDPTFWKYDWKLVWILLINWGLAASSWDIKDVSFNIKARTKDDPLTVSLLATFVGAPEVAADAMLLTEATNVFKPKEIFPKGEVLLIDGMNFTKSRPKEIVSPAPVSKLTNTK